MDRSGFAELLRGFRAERGLTQDALARQAGLSTDAVAAYEQGRRAPGNESAVDQLADALGLDRLDASELRVAAGFTAPPQGLLGRMERFRAAASVWDEVDGPWPTLIMNERHEIVAWNSMANAVAEMDIGTLPALHRNLLRMASTKRFDHYLRNWEQIIGRLISVLKSEGASMDDSAGMPSYLNAIVADIAATPEDSYLLNRLFPLWASAGPWIEGQRNVHPIEWQLADATRLSFVGVFREWSTYDGLFTFDWHPADAATSAWAAQAYASSSRVVQSVDIVSESVGAALRHARRELKMSRAQLAARSGVPAPTIEAYEAGRRRQPAREQLLRLGAGLSLDTYRLNRLLRQAGYEDEPSDFARWMAGEAPRAILAGHAAIGGTTIDQIRAEASTLPWPCFVLDGRCHIVDANPSAEFLTRLSQIPTLPGRPAPPLMQLAVNREVRARLLNWPVVAGTVLPGRLQPLVAGHAGGTKQVTELKDVANHLHVNDRAGLAALFDVWADPPTASNPRRIAVRLDWQTESGELLAFDCLLNPWDSYDPYWAMDWHPASPETFGWMEERGLFRGTPGWTRTSDL